MFYQLRVAREKDGDVLEAFLKQAKTSYEGVKEGFTQFLMLEDSEKNIAGCLGIEKISCDQGLLCDHLSYRTSFTKAISSRFFKAWRCCAKSIRSKPCT